MSKVVGCWLAGFKKQTLLKEKRHYGKAADVQLNEECEKIMEDIKAEARKYPADCMYNMNKTGKY